MEKESYDMQSILSRDIMPDGTFVYKQTETLEINFLNKSLKHTQCTLYKQT